MYLGVKQNQKFEGGKQMSPEAEGTEAGSECGLSYLSQPVFNRSPWGILCAHLIGHPLATFPPSTHPGVHL